MTTTVGQILVNDAIPEKFRDYGRVLDSEGLENLLESVARDDPESYKDTSANLMRIGNRAAFDAGVTLRLSDLSTKFDKSRILDYVEAEESRIRKDKSLGRQEKEALIDELYQKADKEIQDGTYSQELKAGNQMAYQVASKARGSKAQLAAFISSPGVYTDSRGKTVPFFIRHSFAEGLNPAEYWAGSFGARNGTISNKTGTAKGGAFGKLLSSAAIDQVVTEDDCGGANGLPVKVDDDDNLGAVLARDAGKYSAGTVITKSVLSDLRKGKDDEIVIRSPVTCSCKDGVCSKCAGIRETGGFPPIGYNLGLNAASALAERIAQAALNCLAEGTLVRMADGSARPIESVQAGDIVLGSDLNGNVFPTRVIERYDNGYQPCVRTKFVADGNGRGAEGIYLDSTSIHKVLAGGIGPGQKSEKSNRKPRMIEIGKKSSRFEAFTVLTFDDTGLADEPNAMMLGALAGAGREGVYYRVSIGDSCAGREKRIEIYLIKNGMHGKHAHEKTLPPCIHRWSNKSVSEFIGGLFFSDGSVSRANKGHPCISYSSSSITLIRQVKDILALRFGILSGNITIIGAAGDGYRKHVQYKFTITQYDAVKKFSENIRIPGKKSEKLEFLLRKYKAGNHYRAAFNRVSQEDIGIQHVYDLEVDCRDHIYLLANGLIVHNTKHSGKFLKGTGTYQGFPMYTSMAKVPKVYPDKATLSDSDGEVSRIEEAPQGGNYVYVSSNDGEHKMYVPNGYSILAKKGDKVEQGDQLSDGVIDPAELVRYKGIGEGRKYWASRFTQGIRDSGMSCNRRNSEALARSIINTVKLNDEDEAGQGLPGDVVTYARWAFGFKPRPGSVQSSPESAIGSYLEQPALHYTIGTRVTPSVAGELKKFKVQSVLSNKEKPNVDAFMEPIQDTAAETPDWMARLGTTYLKSRLSEDVQRGAESNIHSTNPLPGIAKGTGFGDWGQPGSKNKSPTFTY